MQLQLIEFHLPVEATFADEARRRTTGLGFTLTSSTCTTDNTRRNKASVSFCWHACQPLKLVDSAYIVHYPIGVFISIAPSGPSLASPRPSLQSLRPVRAFSHSLPHRAFHFNYPIGAFTENWNGWLLHQICVPLPRLQTSSIMIVVGPCGFPNVLLTGHHLQFTYQALHYSS